MLEFRLTAVLVFLAVALTGSAQEKDSTQKQNVFTMDVKLMTRGELRRGGLQVNDDNTIDDGEKANFVIERTRLILGYKRDFLEARVNFQHTGLWGMEGGGNIGVHEAWAQLTSRIGFFTRVGRQRLAYDDERILGNNDWAMAALSHDGLKVGYEGHGHKAHAFAAYNQNRKNMNGGTFYQNGLQPYKSMIALWYHYDVPKFPLGASLMFMNVGMENGTETDHFTSNQQLLGGYLTFQPKNLLLEASYYRQMGRASLDYSSAMDMPIHSWMASVKATYDISSQVSAYAGYDYLSGDKDFAVPDPGSAGLQQHMEISAFTSIYGSSHKFYGAMDFFFVSAYYGTNSPGLQNLYGGVVLRPLSGLSLDAAYHYMGITSEVRKLKKALGHEFEFSASYSITPDITAAAGYSFMRGCDTLMKLKQNTGEREMHWAWLMLSISPRIFKTRW